MLRQCAVLARTRNCAARCISGSVVLRVAYLYFIVFISITMMINKIDF